MTKDARKSHQQIMEEAYVWHLTLEEGDVTPENERAFRDWLNCGPEHKAAYEEAESSWRAFGAMSRNHLEPDVSASVVKHPEKAVVRNGLAATLGAHLRYTLSTAAVLVTAVVIAVTQWPDEVDNTGTRSIPVVATYVTGVGEAKSITLSDGTKVRLDAGSELASAMSADSRNLALMQGAAVFEVTADPDRPFSVNAGPVTATALGTVFEVRNNGGQVRVAVEEGRVEYASSSVANSPQTDLGSRRELGAGEFGTTQEDADTNRFGSFDTGSFAAWRKSRLDYEGATLSELVADANRYSVTPIVVEGNSTSIEGVTISASFESTDIESMLAALSHLFPVEVDQSSPGQTVIRVQ